MKSEKSKGTRERKGESDLRELLELARSRTLQKSIDLRVARSAVKDAFALSSRLRLRIPIDEKRKLCKGCYAYLAPGKTSSTRVRNGRIIITCLECGKVKRLQWRKST